MGYLSAHLQLTALSGFCMLRCASLGPSQHLATCLQQAVWAAGRRKLLSEVLAIHPVILTEAQ